MNSQDLQNIQEAYLDVYQQQLDEDSERISKIRSKKPRMRDKDGYPISIGHGVVRTPEQHSRQTNLDTHSIEARVTTDKQLRRHYDRIGRNIASLKKEELEAIIEFLCLEGYAETPEQAEVIMVNMSEEWRGSIVEGEEVKEESQKSFTGEGPKKPKGWRPTGPKVKTGQRPGYAR